MVPGATEYVVTTFFDPPLARGGTTLVPPIVRPEIETASAERGDHLVVYSSGDPVLIEALRASGVPCRVYGMRGGPDGADETDGNLEFRPRSNDGFVEDLRTARGRGRRRRLLAAQRGVYLGKPVLAMPAARPVRAADERAATSSARATGCASERDDQAVLGEFLERLDRVRGSALPATSRTATRSRCETIEARAAGGRRRRRASCAASGGQRAGPRRGGAATTEGMP